MVKCSVCTSDLKSKERITCSRQSCHHSYHKGCVGMRKNDPAPASWMCPECVSQTRRGDDSNTPARTKTLEFCNNMLNLDHDIILLTETWLNDGVLDSELSDNRYELFRRDRGSKGGGVMLLCSRRLSARSRTEWCRNNVECLWVTVDGRTIGLQRDLHVAVAAPGPDLPNRLNDFIQIFSDVSDDITDDYIMIAGDFNLFNIKWDRSGPSLIKKGSVEFQRAGAYLINQTGTWGFTEAIPTLMLAGTHWTSCLVILM
ncbi:hypothetical protein ACJJTC_002315 [Scirpophaga incertulas]